MELVNHNGSSEGGGMGKIMSVNSGHFLNQSKSGVECFLTRDSFFGRVEKIPHPHPHTTNFLTIFLIHLIIPLESIELENMRYYISIIATRKSSPGINGAKIQGL